MTESAQSFDVVVVGAGNAALCAAISARENGARVLVLEKATEDEKGGNSYFTAGGFRFAHEGLDDVAEDILPDLSDAERANIDLPSHNRQFFYEQLMKVTRHQADEDLAWALINNSRETMKWLRQNGVRFIPMYGRQSFEVDGKHRFYGGVNIEAVGGGAGLVEFLLKRCARDRNRDSLRYRRNRVAPGLGLPNYGTEGARCRRLSRCELRSRGAGLRRIRG